MKAAYLTMAAILLAAAAVAAEPVFEKLGPPVRIKALPVGAVTRDPAGYHVAWGLLNVRGHREIALIGARLDNGQTVSHDLSRYGSSTGVVFAGADGNVYVYCGSPAHFFRYDAAAGKVVDLGVPAEPAHYFSAQHVDRNGKAYIGTYPTTSLVWCDTRTGEIGSFGRLSDDPRECYALYTAVADDGMIYSGVGLHHMELWALDPATGRKQQILPETLTSKQGTPTVWTAADGKVYGQGGGVSFLCKPDGIEVLQEAPARPPSPRPMAGEWNVGNIDGSGAITLTHATSGESKKVQTDYQGRTAIIHAVAAERDGIIYGSTALPGNMFTIDTSTGKLTDLGIITTGPLQVYDIISRPQGLFISTYMGCHIDLYRPDQPIEKGNNPHYLGRATGQERPIQWCPGPDGMLYTGTVPAKGRLGGAIMRIDPDKLTIRQFDGVIPNQSIMYLEALPGTDLLYGTGSIGGGSSAIPTEKEAVCFLWDCRQEQVVWQARPVPGTTSYGRAIRPANGLLYGIAQDKFYVFDPVKRETVHTAALPVKGLAFPSLHDEPIGPRGLIVGLGGGAIVALDPETNEARVLAEHPSLNTARAFMVAADGTLYYGCGVDLWRVKLDW